MSPVSRYYVAGAVALLVATPAFAQFESDDFHCPILDNVWTLENPTGDGSHGLVDSGEADAHLTLSFEAGAPHDAWGAGGANESVRVTQPSSDTDFEIEVKWLSEPTGGFQDQGILVEQDADNWLRFDVYHNNSSLQLFVGTTVAGVNTAVLNTSIAAGSASYLRVTRSGDTWTTATSGDGTNFQVQNSFDQAFVVTTVGVYAANPVEGQSWTSEVDYFFNTADPVVPEDPADTDDCFPIPTETVSWGNIKARY